MTEPTYIGPIEEEKENEPKYLGETTQEELVTPWSARYPHLAAIPSTLKELPSEIKRTFTGELPISPREGLYDIPKKPWYERIPEIAAEQIPFREQILGTKEWRTPETAMEGISLYGAGKFLGEAGGAFKRGFPKVAEALTKQRLFPWQKPIAPPKPMVSGIEPPIKPEIPPVVPGVPSVEAVPKPTVVKPEVKVGVQRVEEKGIEIDFEKPQGLYLSPEELKSPHITEGGITEVFNWNPENPLDVSGSLKVKTTTRKTPSGQPVEASAGIKALKQLVGDQEFNRLVGLKKPEMISELTKKYPDVNWNKYTDTYEILEGVAGIKARAKGYDAIVDMDKTNPEFSEYVALNKKVVKPETKVEPPITPETLEAQVKGGPTGVLPKYAGGEEISAINLDRIEGSQDLLQFINQRAIDLEKRIGKHKDTVEGIVAEAERWGLTPKESINMAKKLENFSNQMANIRQIHRNLAEETFNKIRTLPYDPAERTPELMASLKAKLDQYSQMLVATSRVASQWGKAGAILRAEAKYQPEWGYKQLLDRATKLLSDPKKANRFNDIVSRLQELKPDNLEEISKFLYGLQKTRWEKLSSGAYELWISGLVSFPPSHVANIGSNIFTLIESKPEGLLSAGVDIIRSVITKTPRERFAGEIGRDIFSSIKGLHDGLKQFFYAWKTGKADITKFEKMPSALPESVRKFMPTTGLMAEDEFFKGLIKWTELNRISYRQAMKEGLKGEVFKTRLNELISNPTESILEEVAIKAKYLTYQKELGSIGNWVLRGRTIIPGLKYFIPFVRTPANIGKFALERTPLNIPRIIFKAGRKELIGGELSDEIAKALTGTMLGTGTFILAMEEFVTGGGPKNKSEREEKMRTGWQPYSFHIGGKYYPYGRYEPIGSILGIAADFYEIMKNMKEDEKYNVAAGIAGAINNNISNKTFMQGFSTLTDFISDPGRYGERIVSGLVGSIVPGIVAGTARVIDPYLRDAQSIIDRIKTRIPLVSGTVPLRFNIWGDLIERPGTPITRFISPTQVSEEKGTPIDYELEKLPKLNLGMPEKKIKIKGFKEIELEPNEYREMVAKGGQIAKIQLNKLVTRPEFGNLSEEEKMKRIKSIIDRYRENARQLTLRKLRGEGRLIKESYIPLESRQMGGEVRPVFTEMNLSNALKKWEKATPEDKLKMSPYIMKKFQEYRSQPKVNK